MRKTEIKPDICYLNNMGNSCRKVVAIISAAYADGDIMMTFPDGTSCTIPSNAESVVYVQDEGTYEGAYGVLCLDAFATWAQCVDEGTVVGTKKTAHLRSLIAPGGVIRDVLLGRIEPNQSHLEALCDAMNELER